MDSESAKYQRFVIAYLLRIILTIISLKLGFFEKPIFVRIIETNLFVFLHFSRRHSDGGYKNTYSMVKSDTSYYNSNSTFGQRLAAKSSPNVNKFEELNKYRMNHWKELVACRDPQKA